MQYQPVESVPQGEYVRRKAEASKTYQRGEYDRISRRYELVDVDDMNRVIYVKRGTALWVGFTY